MKLLLLSTLILLASLSINAQDFNKKSIIQVSFGSSLPIMTFADKNLHDKESGLASVGHFATVGYEYNISNHFGVIINGTRRIHNVDNDVLKMYSFPRLAGSMMSSKSTNWRLLRIVTGFKQQIDIAKNGKLSLEFRELIGIQFTRFPETQTIGVIPGLGMINFVDGPRSVKALAYGLGVGFNYNFINGIGLKFFGEYQGSDPVFQYSDFELMMPNVQSGYQSTSAISVGLGFTYGF